MAAEGNLNKLVQTIVQHPAFQEKINSILTAANPEQVQHPAFQEKINSILTAANPEQS